jgi:predicted DNA binding protein
MPDPGLLHILLLSLAALVTGGLAWYAWRHSNEPGARPLSAAMVAVTAWTTTEIFALSQTGGSYLFWERAQWTAIAVVPLFFFFFILNFTGYEWVLSRRIIPFFFVIPALSIVLVWTNPAHQLMWSDPVLIHTGGIVTLDQQFGPWFWLYFVYAYTLLIFGFILLLRLVAVSDYLYLDQSLLIVLGILAPLVGNALSVFGLAPLRGLDLTTYGFTVTGVAFGNAIFRYRIFDLLPATRRLGRDTAIATLNDGVLILDNNYRITYLNPEAADILDCDPHEVLGTPSADLVDTDTIDFDTPDAFAELHINSRIYETRPSTITDRQDRTIGHTLVLHDITERKQRERRLRKQRDTLEALDRLNQLVREITQAFVTTTSRSAIESVVCDRLNGSDLYAQASIVFDPTDEIVVGDGGTDEVAPNTSIIIPVSGSEEEPASSDAETLPEVFDTEYGSWSVVPLGYGRSIYGALVLYTTRSDGFNSRERAVLDQFGDTISQAIDAVENQRLLLADTVTELTFQCPDSVLAEVAKAADCRLSLNGLVPADEDKLLVYCHISDGSIDRVVEVVSEIDGITATRVQTDADDVVQFTVTDRSALLAFSAGGTNMRTAEIVDEGFEVVAEVTPGADIRALTERVQEYCPAATLTAKHDRDRPVETGQQKGMLSQDTSEGFTARQREVFEAAYRAGYFESPRSQTAEEVAESINISSPTFHKHLRRAEEQLGEELFDSDDDPERV